MMNPLREGQGKKGGKEEPEAEREMANLKKTIKK
jgi:hypothetical protein